jgi:uncharacterized protein
MADTTNNQAPSMEDILASIRKIIDDDEQKEGVESAPSDAPSQPSEDEVFDLTEVVEEEVVVEDARPVGAEAQVEEDEPLELTELVVEVEDVHVAPFDDVEITAPAGEDLAQAQDGGNLEAQADSVAAAPVFVEPEMPVAEEAAPDDMPVAGHAPEEDHSGAIADAVPEHAEPEQREAEDTMSDDGLISDQARSSAAAALGNLARASERDPLDGVPQGRPIEELVMEQLKPMLSTWLDEHLPAIVERIVEREVRYLSRRLENDDKA